MKKPDIKNIDDIFLPEVLPTSKIRGIAPDLCKFKVDFGNKCWKDITKEIYNFHYDAFPAMDNETLVHFIAGFIKTALIDKYSDIPDFLIYFSETNKFTDFCQLLNEEQREFLQSVISWFRLDGR